MLLPNFVLTLQKPTLSLVSTRRLKTIKGDEMNRYEKCLSALKSD